jgi:PAS domain S-box-containing protein
LAASEKFLNNIVDNIPDMIFVKDAEELRFMRLNRAGEELLGCSRQEMLGKSDYDFFPKEEADFFVATDRQVLERKKMVDIPEETIKTRDLGERLLHTKKIPVLDSEGKPQYLLGISEDITERRQAEEALRKSEAFIKSILQSVDEGFVVIDRDFRIRSANQAYIDICGADVPDLTGRHCYEVCYHADRPCYELGEECPARQVFLSGETKQALHRPGGRMSKPVDYLEVRAYPMRDEAGQFDSVIEILVDVSEKMKLERQLRQAQKMEAIGTLAGGIAHDFNNILSCIIGYGEMVLEGLPPDSPLRDDQAQVLKGGERAVELVKQILAFSRGSEQESRPLLIQFVVKEDLKLLRASIPATIEIRTEIDPGCPAVLADPGRIHQVIMNLGTNAYHAMRETGGVIRFSMRETALPENHLATGVNLPAGRYLELEMSDSGRGIDRDILRRIFEPYFTTKPKGEGTGLGLAIVHGIVTGMGGGIEVDSTPGCGTTFKIYLPVFAGSAAAAGERFRPAMVARGRETIMVLDDEAGIVKLHGKVLEGLGYRVQCFVDCDEALLAFRQNPEGIDLALLDMTMPKRTGVQLAAELLGIRADLPIIICTGFSELINEEQAKTLGIREFLQKPVAKADLAAAVRRALDSPEPGCDELAITTDSPRRPRRTQS